MSTNINKWKMVKIIIPDTKITFNNGKSINKFYENVKGVFNLKSKELTLEKSFDLYNIYQIFTKAEEEEKKEIILSEKNYKKIFELVKSTPGFGDFAGGAELFSAFENSEEAGYNTDYDIKEESKE